MRWKHFGKRLRSLPHIPFQIQRVHPVAEHQRDQGADFVPVTRKLRPCILLKTTVKEVSRAPEDIC